jgi:digeranylgeranylglycerophospholipid reductase
MWIDDMKYDVIVIGSGPAGSKTAEQIAVRGFKVVLLEEHKAVGSPVHCAGLVTTRTLEHAQIRKEEIVLNEISGAIVHTPFGQQIILGGDKEYALVIDRQKFDLLLSNRAQDAGVDLLLETRVLSIEESDNGVSVRVMRKGQEMTILSSLVVRADGSKSMILHNADFGSMDDVILATGGEIVSKSLSQNMVEIFIGSDVAPGWFGWLIPAQDGVSRLGIGSPNPKISPKNLLGKLVDKYDHLRGAQFLKLQGGVIPIKLRKNITSSKSMLVGDVAGQVKSTSGGGIYTSLLAGEMAAEVAIDALINGNFSRKNLQHYEKKWKNKIGQQLLLGAALREILMKFSNHEIESFLNLFNSDEIRNVTSVHGDIDFPTVLFSNLFTPKIMLGGIRNLPLRLWPRLILLLLQWQSATLRTKT